VAMRGDSEEGYLLPLVEFALHPLQNIGDVEVVRSGCSSCSVRFDVQQIRELLNGPRFKFDETCTGMLKLPIRPPSTAQYRAVHVPGIRLCVALPCVYSCRASGLMMRGMLHERPRLSRAFGCGCHTTVLITASHEDQLHISRLARSALIDQNAIDSPLLLLI
jgi:hypothetical protein